MVAEPGLVFDELRLSAWTRWHADERSMRERFAESERDYPDDQPHAPNERLDLNAFQKGIVACARPYEDIGAVRR